MHRLHYLNSLNEYGVKEGLTSNEVGHLVSVVLDHAGTILTIEEES